jgi:nicotinamide-nucleotide amidase
MNANQILAKRLGTELEKRRAFIATAESCTGGWVAKTLTDLPGCSAWFEYGFVTYGNNAKLSLLAVDPVLLEQHGAVSREVAEAMVAGALQVSGAYLAIAVTGIAGPNGGTPDKPVGTVWFAFQAAGAKPVSVCHLFHGDRDTVRRLAVSTALTGVLDYLEKQRG